MVTFRPRELVPAGHAREHLEVLRSLGVGLRTVARRTGLGRTALAQIRSGETRRVHPETARAILGVSGFDRAGGALVDASRTWELVEELAAAGIPRVRVAEALGNRRALQLGAGRVTVAHQEAVEAFHWREWARDPRVRLACRHDPPAARIEEVAR
jgi:transcriptional regulator with XRE-family HTH domain